MNSLEKYAAKRLLTTRLIEKLSAVAEITGKPLVVNPNPKSEARQYVDKHTKGLQAVFESDLFKSLLKPSNVAFKPHPSTKRAPESVGPFNPMRYSPPAKEVKTLTNR